MSFFICGQPKVHPDEMDPGAKVDEWGRNTRAAVVEKEPTSPAKKAGDDGLGGIGYDSAKEAEEEMDPKKKEKLRQIRMAEGELKRCMEDGSVENISHAVGVAVSVGAHPAYIFSARTLMTRLAEGFLGFGPREDPDKPEKAMPAHIRNKEKDKVASFLRTAIVQRKAPEEVTKAITDVQSWALTAHPEVHMLVKSGESLVEVLRAENELATCLEDFRRINKVWGPARFTPEMVAERTRLLEKIRAILSRADEASQQGNADAQNLELRGAQGTATVGSGGLTWEVDEKVLKSARLALRAMDLEKELEKAMRAEDPIWIEAVAETCEEEGVALGEELLMRAAQVKEKVSLEDQLGEAMERGEPGELQEVLERCQLAERASTPNPAVLEMAQTKLEVMQAARAVETVATTGGPGLMHTLREACMRAQEAGVKPEQLEAPFDTLRKWWAQTELSMGTSGAVDAARLLGALTVAEHTLVDASLVEQARELVKGYHRLTVRAHFPAYPAGGAFGSPSWLKNPHLSITVLGDDPVDMTVMLVDAMGDESPSGPGGNQLYGKYALHAVVNREGVSAGHATPGFTVVLDTPYAEERAELQIQSLEPTGSELLPSLILVPSRARAATAATFTVHVVVGVDQAFLPDGRERVQLRLCAKLDDEIMQAVERDDVPALEALLTEAAQSGQDHTVEVATGQAHVIRRRVEEKLRTLLGGKMERMRAEDLEEALLLASEVGAEPELVAEAERQMDRLKASAQLSRATDGGNIIDLNAALLKAQRVGLDSDLVHASRARARQIRAEADLLVALDSGDAPVLLAAYEGAASAGVRGGPTSQAAEVLSAHAVVRDEGEFQGGAGSAYGTPMWGDNPQYRLTADSDTPVEVWLVLTAAHGAKLTDLALHVVTPTGPTQEQATRQHRLVAGTAYSDAPSVVKFVCEPTGGPYYVLPSRSSPSESGQYVLAVLATGNASLERVATLQEELAVRALNRQVAGVREHLGKVHAAGLEWHPVAVAASEALAELEAQEELEEAAKVRDGDRYKAAVLRAKGVKLDAATVEPHIVEMRRLTIEYELLRATDKNKLALMRALLDISEGVGVDGGKVGLAKAVLRQLRCRTQLGSFSRGMMMMRKMPGMGEMREVLEGCTAGGAYGGPTWLSNPQFELKLHGSKPVKVQVSVAETQRDVGLSDHEPTYFNAYAVHLLRNSREAGGVARELIPGWELISHSEYSQAPATVECTLDPSMGPYYIVPSTLDAGEEGTFALSVMSEDLITLKLARPRRPSQEFKGAFDERVFQGKREPNVAEGSVLSQGDYVRRSSITWLNNPQFRLVCRSETALVLVVLQLDAKQAPKGGVGMHLVLNRRSDFLDTHERVLPAQYQTVVHKTPRYEPGLQVALTLSLVKQPGDQPYFLVPSLYKKKLGGAFTLQVYVEKGDVKCEAVPQAEKSMVKK